MDALVCLATIEQIIQEPLKFKAKLAIGENAYTSLKAANRLEDAWNVLSIGTISGTAASSTVIASSFFAPSGLLGILGIGAAVTPIGWVVAAAALGGGLGYGLKHYIRKFKAQQTTTIPKFINTPLDILALGLFELLAPLCLKVSLIDGVMHDKEVTRIKSYFSDEWGFDAAFVTQTLSIYADNANQLDTNEIATALVDFTKKNPDCNYEEISREILIILEEIVQADGIVTKEESQAIDDVRKVFNHANKNFFSRTRDTISATVLNKAFPAK